MRTRQLPFIIIFDIDNTLIGDISHCLDELKILEIINRNCKQKNIIGKCQGNLIDIQSELKEGLLRPYVNDFIEFCEKKYKNVELFVYTNSSHYWTNQVLVPNIEKALGRKFNKPFFTREYSRINKGKTLSFIYEHIVKHLSHKYKALGQDKNQKLVFESRLFMIDDIEGFVKDYPNRQIICPKYTYKPYYDIRQKLITKYKIPTEYFDLPELLEYAHDNFVPIHSQMGNAQQKDKLLCEIMTAYNIRASELTKIPDTFFKDLINIFKNMSDTISDKNITTINNKIKSLNNNK